MTTVFIILILVCGYSAVKIIGELAESRKCSLEDDLKASVLGIIDRDSSQSKSITKHLGVCQNCRD